MAKRMVLVLALGLVFSTGAMAAIDRSLPDKPVKFVIKDSPYKDTITELFKLTNLKVQFGKGVDVDRTVSIDVEAVRWAQLVTAVLDAYKMQYRFVSDDTVEVFKK